MTFFDEQRNNDHVVNGCSKKELYYHLHCMEIALRPVPAPKENENFIEYEAIKSFINEASHTSKPSIQFYESGCMSKDIYLSWDMIDIIKNLSLCEYWRMGKEIKK